MTDTDNIVNQRPIQTYVRVGSHRMVLLVRVFGWSTLSILLVFLINNYLSFWADWPRIVADEYQSERLLNWMRVGFYVGIILQLKQRRNLYK